MGCYWNSTSDATHKTAARKEQSSFLFQQPAHLCGMVMFACMIEHTHTRNTNYADLLNILFPIADSAMVFASERLIFSTWFRWHCNLVMELAALYPMARM